VKLLLVKAWLVPSLFLCFSFSLFISFLRHFAPFPVTREQPGGVQELLQCPYFGGELSTTPSVNGLILEFPQKKEPCTKKVSNPGMCSLYSSASHALGRSDQIIMCTCLVRTPDSDRIASPLTFPTPILHMILWLSLKVWADGTRGTKEPRNKHEVCRQSYSLKRLLQSHIPDLVNA
jgi:hypothetical protein